MNWISFPPFDRSGNRIPTDRSLDDLVYLSHAQPVASRLLTLDLVIDVVATRDPLEEGAASPLHSLQCLLDLKTDSLDGLQLWPHHLDTDGRPNTCGDHVDAGADREQPRIREGRNLDRAVK